MVKKPVLSREAVYDTEDRFEMEAGYYPGDILPRTERAINRPIIIKDGCVIHGVIFGGRVQLGNNVRALGIYGDQEVVIGESCEIVGYIQSSGKIRVGSNTKVLCDIIGKEIDIWDKVRIYGNVIADGNINVGNDVEIGGYVVSLNGSIGIGDNSKVFDIIAYGNIELGHGVVIADPVIWSQKGKITLYSKIKVGKNYEVVHDRDRNIVESNKINLHYILSRTFTKSLYNDLIKSLGGVKTRSK
ncbi:hypothetical protein [Staphylothermus hellenicus]|uniref:Uncharacterized protein n=1 Tax=Staphylothermus hellenicus (strain DSM 12710 / JCM 10830 / BK20S6-10-b1 / P8) TaxID=591019 RepID=D7DBS8_STAHD|nr:hypothetical protein [Staphylothermus hellenicus]ADI31625.1 hypothetical protein Shell_0494 [Staphylothermus hellenicus DSM 12710]